MPGLLPATTLCLQALGITYFQVATESDADHRHQRDQQCQLENIDVHADFVGFVHHIDTAELVDIQHRHEDTTADHRDPAEGLHGGMHQANLRRIDRLALCINTRHGFHGHRIGNHVLNHITDGGEQGTQYIPGRQWHHRAHVIGMAEQANHNQQAGSDQTGADIDEDGLETPDQIHDMTHRHFQRPGDIGPEHQGGEEFGG